MLSKHVDWQANLDSRTTPPSASRMNLPKNLLSPSAKVNGGRETRLRETRCCWPQAGGKSSSCSWKRTTVIDASKGAE